MHTNYLQKMQELTPISNDYFDGEFEQPQLDNSWSSGARKNLHEDYWTKTILIPAQKICETESITFDSLWERINLHEVIFGSARGRKLIKRQNRKKFISNIFFRNENARHDGIEFERCVPLLFKNSIQLVSPMLATRFMRDELLSLVGHHSKGCDAIVDLGSGWGRYATLFADRFRNHELYAGEISEGGRNVTKFINEQYNLGICSFQFDYQNWQGLNEILEKLSNKRILIFSNHSIEQVTYLNKKLFYDIIKSVKDVKFLHIEPVGWQVDPSKSTLLHSKPPRDKLGPNGGYNKNLWNILKALELEGKISGLAAAVNYIANDNVDNAGTKLVYEAS